MHEYYPPITRSFCGNIPSPTMNQSIRLLPRYLLVLGTLLGAGTTLLAKDTPDSQRAEIRQTRDAVLKELYELRPGAKAKIEKSVGYAVFSNVGINVVFASFAGGHGIVVEKGMIRDTETFMKMGSAGLGLGLGVKDFRAVFIFKSAEKLRAFVDKGWDFSGQVDAAAKSDDKGAATTAAADIAKDVEIYQITKNGLALQATLQGTKYWQDDDLN
jgi:lipid-binding SYLF domain-containing protein